MKRMFWSLGVLAVVGVLVFAIAGCSDKALRDLTPLGEGGTPVVEVDPSSAINNDIDGDGIPNDEDSCPATVNTGLDWDTDDIDNACDETPGTAPTIGGGEVATPTPGATIVGVRSMTPIGRYMPGGGTPPGGTPPGGTPPVEGPLPLTTSIWTFSKHFGSAVDTVRSVAVDSDRNEVIVVGDSYTGAPWFLYGNFLNEDVSSQPVASSGYILILDKRTGVSKKEITVSLEGASVSVRGVAIGRDGYFYVVGSYYDYSAWTLDEPTIKTQAFIQKYDTNGNVQWTGSWNATDISDKFTSMSNPTILTPYHCSVEALSIAADNRNNKIYVGGAGYAPSTAGGGCDRWAAFFAEYDQASHEYTGFYPIVGLRANVNEYVNGIAVDPDRKIVHLAVSQKNKNTSTYSYYTFCRTDFQFRGKTCFYFPRFPINSPYGADVATGLAFYDGYAYMVGQTYDYWNGTKHMSDFFLARYKVVKADSCSSGDCIYTGVKLEERPLDSYGSPVAGNPWGQYTNMMLTSRAGGKLIVDYAGSVAAGSGKVLETVCSGWATTSDVGAIHRSSELMKFKISDASKADALPIYGEGTSASCATAVTMDNDGNAYVAGFVSDDPNGLGNTKVFVIGFSRDTY